MVVDFPDPTGLFASSYIVSSPASPLVEQLNEAIIRPKIAWMPPTLFLCFGAVMLFINCSTFPVFLLLATASAPIGYWLDQKNGRVDVLYEDDLLRSSEYQRFTSEISQALRNEFVWLVRTSQAADPKYTSGASTLISSTVASITVNTPLNVYSNAEILEIKSGTTAIYLTPELLILTDGTGYYGAKYTHLKLHHYISDTSDTTAHPRDAVHVGSTWRYINKDGSPDRRFANNYQVPIFQYSYVEIHCAGISLTLKLSRRDAGLQLVQAITEYSQTLP